MPRDLHQFVEDACGFDPADSMLPLTIEGMLAGWVKKSFAEHLAEFPALFSVRPRGVGMIGHFDSAERRSAALGEVIEVLAGRDIIRGWRNEQVSIAESFYSPPLLHVERAATRYFGFTTHAVHLNGLNIKNGEAYMWIAERAASRPVDPGKLDNLVAGLIARGATPLSTVIKEAGEEAGLDPTLAAKARSAGAVRCKRQIDEGLHHEITFVHDLVLPADFVPQNQDGEVKSFRLLPVAEVISMLETPGIFTVDAAIVILDCLIRRGELSAARGDYLDIIHAIRP